jgi:uncharacterized protein (DUF433 family)
MLTMRWTQTRPRGPNHVRSEDLVNVTIPDDLVAAIEKAARSRGQDPDTLIAELVTEAMKMREVPGIVFADGPVGRRARVEGTGIEVFEVIQAYLACDLDREDLRRAFHWLDEQQFNAALEYYKLFPNDVEPFLVHDDQEMAAESPDRQ